MITVLCPTRGRPEAVREAAASLVSTRRLGDTQFVAVLDHDEPRMAEYTQGVITYRWTTPLHTGGMVAALNAAAMEALTEKPQPDIIGFIGDDHRFRTEGWDVEVASALRNKPGFAYGYDGFWHQGEIPTQIFINTEIIAALGYYALPDCFHLYVDNAWKELALATDSLTYLPRVIIEHMHPAIGKAEWDEGHVRVNSQEMYGRDGAAFSAWRTSQRFLEDVERVRAALPRPHTVPADKQAELRTRWVAQRGR